MAHILDYEGTTPTFDDESAVWLAPTAVLVGDVRLAKGVSVWFGATMRGDNEPIIVGESSNIQENCVLHADPGFPLTIEDNCTIGHAAILHGCKISSNTIVGMGAVVLNGAVVGKNCIVGAGAVIKEKAEIPDGSLVVGSPAVVKRQLSPEAIARLPLSAEKYASKAMYVKGHWG